MRKRISLKTRRPDLSRSEFRNYYENQHVPLGLTFIDRFGWRRYVRNHVLTATGTPVGFDCYAEFWVDDDFDDRALEEFIGSPEFQKLDVDDRCFLDVTRRLSFEVCETLVSRGGGEAHVARNGVVLWTRGAEPVEETEGVARRIVDSFGERVVDAVLDRPIEAIPSGAPFDTLLKIRFGDAGPVVLDATVVPGSPWSLITVDPIETPSDLLRSVADDKPNQ